MNLITMNIPGQWVEKAQMIRARRDLLYGNIYEEEDTDLRWTGDLGEICFNHWLKRSGVRDAQWHLENAAGQADFTINGVRTDVKTVKRKGPPRLDYTAQITARHKDHPIDQLFFMSYEYPAEKMWFLGGISMAGFIAAAAYYGQGEQVHEHYRVRKGHEIYNARLTILQAPEQWLNGINTMGGRKSPENTGTKIDDA
ncbi:hypothetical protein [Hufsiella ginkgonis]|uniref:hypothetical protein n=1 Tax=Hufsiella ginkgonis TaxID=2695274 RepID=UPI001925C1EC|nr:hypothetical protein [Hufsiella ginkgonis]